MRYQANGRHLEAPRAKDLAQGKSLEAAGHKVEAREDAEGSMDENVRLSSRRGYCQFSD